MFWQLLNVVHLFSVIAIGIAVESSAPKSWMRDNQNGALVMAAWCAIGIVTRFLADRERGEGPTYFWYIGLVGFGIFFLNFGLSGELP